MSASETGTTWAAPEMRRPSGAPCAPAEAGRLPPVLFLLNALNVGGSETKSVRMANALIERGGEVTVTYLNPPEQLLPEIAREARVVPLQRRGKFSLRALLALVKTIRTLDTPVVVAVNLYPALYAGLARLWLGRRRFRLIVSVNTTDFPETGMRRRMLLYRRMLGLADTIVFGAELQRHLWRERYGFGDERSTSGPRTAVLYNGVDVQRYAAAPAGASKPTHLPRTRFLVGTVGRMRPEKAHIHLVRAIAALRARGIDAGAVIVGDGPERTHVEAEIAHLQLQDFIALPGESRDVRPFLAAMDLFVMCSTGIETFSNAALEALASGVPVICSRVGGMEELIAHGGGVSYPAGDIAQLTEILSDLLTHDDKRQQLARSARHAAETHFDWNRMVEGFITLASSATVR